LPIFSNSFFNTEDVEDKSNAPTVTSGVNINKHTFKDLRDVRRSYPKKCIKDLSANLEKCSVNSLFDIEGGLYAPAINHFLSLIYTS
jgi:hypothetical protein